MGRLYSLTGHVWDQPLGGIFSRETATHRLTVTLTHSGDWTLRLYELRTDALFGGVDGGAWDLKITRPGFTTARLAAERAEVLLALEE